MKTIAQTHLYGARIWGMYHPNDFIFDIKDEGRMQIIHVSSGDEARHRPFTIEFADRNGGRVFSIEDREVLASDELMSRLSEDDQAIVRHWASAELPYIGDIRLVSQSSTA